MRQMRVGLGAAIVLALLPFLAAEDSAKIVVYSTWDSPQRGKLTIFCDGVRMAEVQAGRFFVINAEPGRHVLVAGDGIPTTVEARAKGESFVRVAREMEVGPSGKASIPVLEDRSAEEAIRDLIHLVYLQPAKIFSTSVSEKDPFAQQPPKLKTRDAVQ